MKKRISAILFTIICMMMLVNMTLTVSAASDKPGKVKMIGVYATDYNKICAVWDKTSNATDYIIYYKAKGASKWIKKASAGSNARDYTVSFEVGEEIEVGKEYVCTVRAFNKKTNKYGSYDTKGIPFKTLPEKVLLSDISLNSSKTGIDISWQKELTGGAIQGGDYYLIYRKEGGKWKQIAKVKSDVLTYTDENFSYGKINTYTVASFNSKTKTKGEYDKKGVSIDLSKKTPSILLDSSRTDVMLKGSTGTYTYYSANTVKWSSNNKNIIKILSSNNNKCQLKALKDGTAKITIRDGNMVHTFTVIVASGDAFVNKWVQNMASQFRSGKKDTESRLLAVSMFILDNFKYDDMYDLKSVISQKKGNCYSAGELMARIYRAMGYKAKVRSAIHDKKSRYPSNFIMGSDHYNVEVIADGRTYYLDATPELNLAYLSSPSEPLLAYFYLFNRWQRIL